MFKRFFLFLITLVMQFIVTDGFAYKIRVNAEIKGVGSELSLAIFDSKGYRFVDTVKSELGSFVFKDVNITSPVLASISTPGRGVIKQFFIDDKDITIKGNAKYSVVRGSLSDDIYNMEFPKYRNSVDSISIFVSKYPNNIVSAYVIYQFLSRRVGYDDLMKVISLLSPSMRKSFFVSNSINIAQSKNKFSLNSYYTDIALQDSLSREVRLSDVVSKGKYVLLCFSGSWCKPCESFYNTLKDVCGRNISRSLYIYRVSVENSASIVNWKNNYKGDSTGWYDVTSSKGINCPAVETYMVDTLPCNYLISPEGMIVSKNIKPMELYRVMNEFEIRLAASVRRDSINNSRDSIINSYD